MVAKLLPRPLQFRGNVSFTNSQQTLIYSEFILAPHLVEKSNVRMKFVNGHRLPTSQGKTCYAPQNTMYV